ncbi:MAG: bifunctional UDP-N-acetylglucosamine diphosphorylase/glucosamine-1-phosphate N-acetyltransferase GlmU [Clostridium sp.]|nr:bifunctional UDP-N-acetylglucosamine diphosphorylase/glucosamine-1-phosphate N-acetyltransferase GlmU [Clostridium sp.]
MDKYAIILAAGDGTRMKSKTSKVLHKICGKELVNHVIDIMKLSGLQEINVIVGKSKDDVIEKTKSRDVSYSIQEEQLGTGHAVLCAKNFIKDKNGSVAIFTGDAPLVTEETVVEMFNQHEKLKSSATVLTSIIDDAKGYGRIVRDGNGDEVLKIVEDKDCNAEEKLIQEINSGMYIFDIKDLLLALESLDNNNSQGEYYLTDVISIMKSENLKVRALVTHMDEIRGINSRVQLAEAEIILRERINLKHMENGVTFIDKDSTYIGTDVIIGRDTIIYPNNILEGKTIIGEDVILYQNNRISDSKINNNTSIESSVILESEIGKNTKVGPFAYIRPESQIGDNVKIGDFVEIKKSIIGSGTKVSHHTYIGDSKVGKNVNFGCGTVVVNYDGKNKHETIIEDDAFIGCNTNLISPVKVGENSYIAAGSTVTDDVPKNSLAVARSKQVNKLDWVIKKKK